MLRCASKPRFEFFDGHVVPPLVATFAGANAVADLVAFGVIESINTVIFHCSRTLRSVSRSSGFSATHYSAPVTSFKDQCFELRLREIPGKASTFGVSPIVMPDLTGHNFFGRLSGSGTSCLPPQTTTAGCNTSLEIAPPNYRPLPTVTQTAISAKAVNYKAFQKNQTPESLSHCIDRFHIV
jgi:hypothetical protein